MTISSALFAFMLYVATSAIFVFGTSCLIFLATYVAVYVFREVLSARGILEDFVRWRSERKEATRK